MRQKIPCVKGIFVQSHLNHLRAAQGDSAVAELERRIGRPLSYRRGEDVPVRQEALIIAEILDLLGTVPASATACERERAAGRLHFVCFTETTFGAALLGALPHTAAGFKTLMFNGASIVRFIFTNLTLHAEERRNSMVVTMENSEYPPEHFAGFFEAWLGQWGLPATVSLRVRAPGVHEYTLAPGA